MLVIKKRFLQPMTYLYTGIGITVFTLTLGTLVALNPKLNTERSVAIITEQPTLAPAAGRDTAVSDEVNTPTPAPSPTVPANSTTTSSPQVAQTTRQQSAPPLTPSQSAQSEPKPAQVEPESPEATSTEAPVETPTPVAVPSTTEPTAEENPSLLGGLLGGVGNLLNAVL